MELKNEENIEKIVSQIFYGKRPDATPEEISDAVLFFYRAGESSDEKDGESGRSGNRRIFDIDYDAALLYSAFWEQYGISLASDNLHWWAYKALFAGLSEKCRLSKIMGYRAMEITADMTAKQQEFYRKMQKKYAIPLPEKQQEEIDAIEQALLNGGDLTGVI